MSADELGKANLAVFSPLAPAGRDCSLLGGHVTCWN